MNRTFAQQLGVFAILLALAAPAAAAETAKGKQAPRSDNTQDCIDCHIDLMPGVVHDWMDSAHAKTTPAQAMKKREIERLVSATEVPEDLRDVAVGCYECHSLNGDKHKDNFDHEGYMINVVVSPNDCATCHPTQVDEYADSKKANAIENLTKNPVYHQLVNSLTTTMTVDLEDDGKITHAEPNDLIRGNTCFACHGLEIKVDGMKTVETPDGEMEFPNLINWPNQGVGRINPDGSKGACTACHARHSFSLEMARKPYTCLQCHEGPDVPAGEVWEQSKHGNIYNTKGKDWNFSAVPWKVGEHYKAPTCVVCHAAEVVAPDETIIAKGTHDYGERLWVRLFGLPYAVTQPVSGATHTLRNDDGLPLPVTFLNKPAQKGLLSATEVEKRRTNMATLCRACHSTDWAQMHFVKLDAAIEETNKMTLQATKILSKAWEEEWADPSNPFDEAIELDWVKTWLIYSNSIRYGAAMGGPDLAAFKNGYWELSKHIIDMRDSLHHLDEHD